MTDLPAVFRKPTSQVIHALAIPLAFFAFVLIYSKKISDKRCDIEIVRVIGSDDSKGV